MVRAKIIKAKNSDKKIAEIHAYGEVTDWQAADVDDWGCINLKTLTDELTELGGTDAFDEIKVRINSPGGNVEEGFAIYNYLRSLNKPITTIADGKCHSIASVIFMAGDIRQIFKTTEPIIHNAWAYTAGNANELEETAEMLRNLDEQILDIYAERSGTDKETIRPFMANDNPMKADVFLELKLCTEIIEPVKAYASVGKKIKPTEKPNNQMNKISKVFADAFKRLRELGVPVNAVFQTTDGKELNIDTGDGDTIEVGQSVTIDGAAAPDGDYVLEDGRTISVAEGKVSAIKEKEEGGGETIEQLKAKIAELEATIAAGNKVPATEIVALKTKAEKADAYAARITELEAENAELIKDAKKITEHLKNIKVDFLPEKRGALPKLIQNQKNVEVSTKDAEKAKMKDLLDKARGKKPVAAK